MVNINLYTILNENSNPQPNQQPNIIDSAINTSSDFIKNQWNSMTDKGKLYTQIGAGSYIGSKLLIGQDYYQAVRQYLRLHPTNPICQFILEHPSFTAMAASILIAANYKKIGLGLKNFLMNHGIIKNNPSNDPPGEPNG